MEAPYLFHASQDTRRLVKGLRCCSCLIFSLLCQKYEVGKKGVVICLVVLGQNGIDVSELGKMVETELMVVRLMFLTRLVSLLECTLRSLPSLHSSWQKKDSVTRQLQSHQENCAEKQQQQMNAKISSNWRGTKLKSIHFPYILTEKVKGRDLSRESLGWDRCTNIKISLFPKELGNDALTCF